MGGVWAAEDRARPCRPELRRLCRARKRTEPLPCDRTRRPQALEDYDPVRSDPVRSLFFHEREGIEPDVVELEGGDARLLALAVEDVEEVAAGEAQVPGRSVRALPAPDERSGDDA